MIPESGGIMIALVGESDFIKENLYVDNVCGFDLSDFNSIINRKHGIKNRHDDINIISDPRMYPNDRNSHISLLLKS